MNVPRSVAHAHQPSFDALVAEQLRRAPWLLLSIVIHAIAVLVLLLLPSTPRLAHEMKVNIAARDVEPAIDTPPPPPPPPVEKVERRDEPLLSEVDTNEAAQTPNDAPDLAPSLAPSAFDSNNANTALGLGGGAAGGDRGGRGARRRLAPRLTQKSVEEGLQWLARHQDEEGRWDAVGFMKHDTSGTPCDGAGDGLHDVGITGLALLAFLGDGNTLSSGTYCSVVKRAVLWLRDQQDENGRFGAPSNQQFVYDHAIATLAMCEACGLSDSKILRQPAQRGIDYLEQHRNPYGVWRYAPHGGDSDVSVTAWAVMAYKSALDFHLNANKEALRFAESYFDEMTDASGRTGYIERGGRSSRRAGESMRRFPAQMSEAMTGASLLCRVFLGEKPADHPIMARSADILLARKPVWNATDGSIDHYYWYYGTYALFQMGGHWWPEWIRALTDAVVKTQRKDANFEGSWDPAGAWGADGGRVYSTAILVLTLEAYYRHDRLLGAR